MSSQSMVNRFASPGVQCLIPMIYVAWADQVLTPTEIKVLKEKAGQLPFLTQSDKIVLQEWTNPRKPPSRELFKYWEIKLKEIVETEYSGASWPPLVELGVALAKNAVGQNGQEPEWLSKRHIQLLQELEAGLSKINLETYQNLLQRI